MPLKELDFPELIQTDEYDCGATSLESVIVYYWIKNTWEIDH